MWKGVVNRRLRPYFGFAGGLHPPAGDMETVEAAIVMGISGLLRSKHVKQCSCPVIQGSVGRWVPQNGGQILAVRVPLVRVPQNQGTS